MQIVLFGNRTWLRWSILRKNPSRQASRRGFGWTTVHFLMWRHSDFFTYGAPPRRPPCQQSGRHRLQLSSVNNKLCWRSDSSADFHISWPTYVQQETATVIISAHPKETENCRFGWNYWRCHFLDPFDNLIDFLLREKTIDQWWNVPLLLPLQDGLGWIKNVPLPTKVCQKQKWCKR